MNHTATHQMQVHLSKDQWVKYLWVGFAFVLLGILISMSSVSYANNTTYYINNQSGSNCSNGGSGTSTSQPWCDFTNVNTTTFQPGDNILLARGAVWNQELHLNGSGTSTNWITVDAYGTGNKPKIQRNSNAEDRTVFMYDSSYWIVKNLEIANAGNGIKVNYTTLGHEGLRFENLYIHNIDLVVNNSPATSDNLYASKGIWIVGKDAPIPSSTQWVLRDLKITNNEIAYTTDPIVVNQITSSENKYSFRNIRIKNNYIHDAKGVIGIRDVTDGKMISNRLNNLGTVALPQGTTGIFQWMTENITYVNNYMNLVPNTNSTDETMIDHEGYVNNTYLYSNYIANTDGPGVEYLQLSSGNPPRDPATDHNTNNYVTGNVFVSNNGYSMKVYSSNGNTVTGSITDNLYHQPTSGFTTGDFSGFTFSNNKNVSSSGNIYNAGQGFSGTQGTNQTSYQYYDGTSWSNISSYDSTNQWWGSSSYYVSRFDLLPGSGASTWVARKWTAPSDGTISIRGRVLKNDIGGGDGVRARITKNGIVIWGTQSVSSTDESGYNTNLDTISVVAGDVIRFEVNSGSNGNNANDLTSWSPTVAYTSVQAGTTTVDSNSTSITYSGGTWYESSDTGDYNGSIKYNGTSGSYTEFTFTGTSIKYGARKGVSMGIVDVYLDGVKVATVDLYASSKVYQVIAYQNTSLTSGSHTIKVVNTGTKNASATEYNLNVDFFEYSSSATTVDSDSTSITYSGGGTWNASSDTGDYNGSIKYNGTSGSYAELTFTGTSIKYGARKGVSMGIVDVYLDGVKVATVDLYASSKVYQVIAYQNTSLTSGMHTIKVVNTGTKNASATEYNLNVDFFEYSG